MLRHIEIIFWIVCGLYIAYSTWAIAFRSDNARKKENRPENHDRGDHDGHLDGEQFHKS